MSYANYNSYLANRAICCCRGTTAPFPLYKQVKLAYTNNTINNGIISAELTNGGLSAPVSLLWNAAVAASLKLSSIVVCEITFEAIFDGSGTGGTIFTPNDNGATLGAITLCYVPSYTVNGGPLLYFPEYSIGQSKFIQLPNAITTTRVYAAWTAFQTSVKLICELNVSGLQPADNIVFYLNAYTQSEGQVIDTKTLRLQPKFVGGITLKANMTKNII